MKNTVRDLHFVKRNSGHEEAELDDLLDHIRVPDAFKQRYFSNGRARNSIVFFLKLDLFQGNSLNEYMSE